MLKLYHLAKSEKKKPTLSLNAKYIKNTGNSSGISRVMILGKAFQVKSLEEVEHTSVKIYISSLFVTTT